MTDNDNSEELKKLNKWLAVLVAFILIWAVGMMVYVEKKSDVSSHRNVSIVMVDPTTGKIANVASYTNLFPNPRVSTETNSIVDKSVKPLYEQKSQYEVRDVVLVNYFFVEGMIVEKHGNDYTVLYKDHNKVLQKVILPKEFLLAPTSYNAVNPVSLLAH